MTDAALLRFIELQNSVIEMLLVFTPTSSVVSSINALRSEVSEKLGDCMAQIDDLEKSVEKNTDVSASAITLLNGLSQMIKDAGTDPGRLQTITSALDSSQAALAAAILANTPQAEEAA